MKKLILTGALCISAPAWSAAIYVQQEVPYQDASRIDSRITSECTKLNSVLSEAIVKYGQQNGLEIVREAGDLSQKPVHVKVVIESAISAGNAFIGHAKGMALYVELYVNGQVVHKTTFTRNSMGGFMGGFKGSCAVLNRTANTLGKDVANWLKLQSTSM